MVGYRVLKFGGVMVYLICMIDFLENEEVVDYFFRKMDVRFERIDFFVKISELVFEWEGKEYLEELKKVLRIYLNDNDIEVFFIVKIVKLGDGGE